MVLSLWLVNQFIFKNAIPNLVYYAYHGPGVFFSRQFANFSAYSKSFFNRSGLIDENDKLKKENYDLLGRLAVLEELKRENESLRRQLNVSQRSPRKLLIADVFSAEKTDISSTMLIDKGVKDGVEKKMAVISGGNVLAGVIEEVFDGYSKVMLLNDPRSDVSVRIGGLRIVGGVKGSASGGNKVILDFVTNKDPVQEGDLIMTSGLDNLPESLLVGRVSKVDLSGGNLFKEVEADLMFDLSLESNIFVILN